VDYKNGFYFASTYHVRRENVLNSLSITLREPFNCISHGVAAILSTVGLVLLLFHSNSPIQWFASGVYGLSLVFLYTSSSFYHGFHIESKRFQIFHRLDHAAIYALIAGTATPVALIALDGWIRWTMFLLLWSMAIPGMILTVLNPSRSPKLNTSIYLGMGWISVVFLEPLIDVFSWEAIVWCLVGGLIYTIGALIYAFQWPRFDGRWFGSHELWHIFVILGSGSHYIFIAVYTY